MDLHKAFKNFFEGPRASEVPQKGRDGCSFDFYLSVDKVTDLSVI